MAKKKASRPRRAGSGTVNQILKSIERIDRDLVKTLNERAKLVERAKRQLDDGDQTHDVIGEHRLGREISEWNRGPLDDESLKSVFREVVSGARGLVKPVRVAYLGPKYSYSYLATIDRFGESAALAPVSTIAAVFEEVHSGHSDHGVVPLENSTDGRIVDTLDMFAKSPARICGEVQMRIHHNLLAKCARDEIKEVYSKPQALSQCRDWLVKHLPWARTVEMNSTATAAQLAADKEGAAAIASRLAASNYGLNILAENIEDNSNNVTRFAVIGGDAARRTGKDKTAVMFEISHRPGSLADVMGIFKRGRLNLTWIESFPMSGSRNEYLFFVEMEGHENDAKVKKALASLTRKTVRLEVLGSYARSEPIE